MNNHTYIKMFRKFTEWGWYKDTNTKVVFLHLLLKANYSSCYFKGYEIKRGQAVIGLNQLSLDLGLSVMKIRTALAHLEQTNEITRKITNKFSLVTIVKYDNYQENNKQVTNKQQASNKQVTTIKERKNIRSNYYTNNYTNELFNDFLEMRKKLKAVNSDKAIKLLLNKLEPFSDDIKNKMIENAIANSWKSVYELKEYKQDQTTIKEPSWFNQTIEKEMLQENENIELKGLLSKYD